MQRKLLGLFALVCALTACAGPTGSGVTIPSSTPTPVPTSTGAAATSSPSASPTAVTTTSPTATAIPTTSPTATPTPSPSPSPTAKPTSTPTPTPTPSPTSSPTAKPTATPTAGATSTPLVTPGPGLGLHVVGNIIENGAGQQFIPHGVNRSGSEYDCVQGSTEIFDGPVDQASITAMLTWHINAVRVPLNEDCWLGINGVAAAVSGSNYQDAIESFVNLLSANGLAVILDLHWNDGGTAKATGQQDMADADHAGAFWTSVATAFKNNSSVMFDLYNEPHSITWACWLNGGTATACATPWAIDGMNQLITAVRSTGATNIVLAGGLAYSNDLSGWLANEPTDPAGQLVADWHIYNFNACITVACWASTGGAVAAKVPLIADETGENGCTDTFVLQLYPWLDSIKTGYLGWTWNADFNCSTGPGLITDYAGDPTAYGIGLQSHLAALASASSVARKASSTR